MIGTGEQAALNRLLPMQDDVVGVIRQDNSSHPGHGHPSIRSRRYDESLHLTPRKINLSPLLFSGKRNGDAGKQDMESDVEPYLGRCQQKRVGGHGGVVFWGKCTPTPFPHYPPLRDVGFALPPGQ